MKLKKKEFLLPLVCRSGKSTAGKVQKLFPLRRATGGWKCLSAAQKLGKKHRIIAASTSNHTYLWLCESIEFCTSLELTYYRWQSADANQGAAMPTKYANNPRYQHFAEWIQESILNVLPTYTTINWVCSGLQATQRIQDGVGITTKILYKGQQ